MNTNIVNNLDSMMEHESALSMAANEVRAPGTFRGGRGGNRGGFRGGRGGFRGGFRGGQQNQKK